MSRLSRQPRDPCVLLVEDEVGTQDALSTLLEMDGWRVVRAADGAEALAHLEKLIPDVIVTDYMMPNMDGLAMIERIRETPRLAGIPIVLVSATGIEADMRRRVDAFMRKPVDLSALRKILATLGSAGDGAD